MRDVDPTNLTVAILSRHGIILHDTRAQVNYAVACSLRPGAQEVEFDLVPQPAWPAVEEHELRASLGTVYDAEGVDLWIRAARARAWTIEYAAQRAAQLVDGAFA